MGIRNYPVRSTQDALADCPRCVGSGEGEDGCWRVTLWSLQWEWHSGYLTQPLSQEAPTLSNLHLHAFTDWGLTISLSRPKRKARCGFFFPSQNSICFLETSTHYPRGSLTLAEHSFGLPLELLKHPDNQAMHQANQTRISEGRNQALELSKAPQVVPTGSQVGKPLHLGQFLYQSARAAMTKYCRLGGLNNRN